MCKGFAILVSKGAYCGCNKGRKILSLWEVSPGYTFSNIKATKMFSNLKCLHAISVNNRKRTNETLVLTWLCRLFMNNATYI